MIDPKLNELPVTGADARRASKNEREVETQGRPSGLSIRDTVAGDTLLSSGNPGVDTSGVRAGAGAGAGSSALTLDTGASPAPHIVPGARTTGMTATGSNPSGTGPTGRADTGVPGAGQTDADVSSLASNDDLSYDEISQRAYECWCERGCPEGSPHVDWELAQQRLREERRRNQYRTASAS